MERSHYKNRKIYLDFGFISFGFALGKAGIALFEYIF